MFESSGCERDAAAIRQQQVNHFAYLAYFAVRSGLAVTSAPPFFGGILFGLVTGFRQAGHEKQEFFPLGFWNG